MELLYKKYIDEIRYLDYMPRKKYDEFMDSISGELNEMDKICIYDGEVLQGIIYYSCWEENNIMHCFVPVFGYYADSEKTLARLFQKLAGEIVTDKKTEFSVHLYAHDFSSINAFHLMQFGTMSEKSVKKISETMVNIEPTCEIRVLAKAEIKTRWNEVWSLTNEIVTHLQRSPIFYPGKEFTEDVYREFFMDETTELLVAFHENEMVGMIEWNREANTFICGKHMSVNVGEAYVAPVYRGTNLSVALLTKAEERAKKIGAEYMWVEHGTANPNARGFWNKYFQTYQYELVRTIEKI